MDGPREFHTEWSRSEREKQILYNTAYMWNLEKWYRLTYLQSINRDTDIENTQMGNTQREHRECMGTRRGAGGGMNGEVGIDIYTLLCIRWGEVRSLSRVRLCNPMDCSPPGSSVHGILQARILEWVSVSFFKGPSRPRNRTQVSSLADSFFFFFPILQSLSFFFF